LYMSPEQAVVRKVPIDHRTDIYSLGATLYQLLVSRPPFRGRDYQDTLSQIVTRDPPPLTAIEPRVPQDLENIVLKCLRKESHHRYGTSEALAQDLRRFLAGNPVEARPQPLWEKLRRRLYRQKAQVLVCLCAVLFLASSGLLLQKHRAEERAAGEARYRDLITEGAMLLEMTGMTARAASTRETA